MRAVSHRGKFVASDHQKVVACVSAVSNIWDYICQRYMGLFAGALPVHAHRFCGYGLF